MNRPNLNLAAAFALSLGIAVPGAASPVEPSDTHTRLMAQLRDFQNRQHPARPTAQWKPGVTVVVPPVDSRLKAAEQGNGVAIGGAGTLATSPQAAQR